MRSVLSWSFALLSLAACAALIVLLAPDSEVEFEREYEQSPPVTRSDVAARPNTAAGDKVEIKLPVDVLTGRFTILENREWTIEELENCQRGNRIFPLVWGAGRLVDAGATSVTLEPHQSLGYSQTRTRWMTSRELDAVIQIPRIAGLSYDPSDRLGRSDHLRALGIEGLRYVETVDDVLRGVNLPTTITSLSLLGADVEWDFPWITSFQSRTDYYDSSIPPPRNLDNVQFMDLDGWPRDLPLPPKLRRLSVPFGSVSPFSLSGPKALEWFGDYFSIEWDGDIGVESIAHQPCIRRLWVDCAGMTDAGLSALSSAVQLEYLRLDIAESKISERGLSALTRLPRLADLEIRGELDQAGLRALIGCNRLASLKIAVKQIGEEEMFVLAALTSLDDLELGESRFSGEGLRYFAERHIELSARLDRLTAKGFDELMQYWPASSLYLGYFEQFSDDDVAALAKLQNLTELRLGENPGITEAGLLAILKLPKLESLNLERHELTEFVIENLGQCKELKKLTLPGFKRDDPRVAAVWRLVDRCPGLEVYADRAASKGTKSRGNYYGPDERPE